LIPAGIKIEKSQTENRKQTMKAKTKLNQLILITTFAVAPATLTLTAAETNVTGTAANELPGYVAESVADRAAEAAEIKSLKEAVQALTQKVETLERQHSPDQQAATIQDLDQKVRILARERENDQDAAATLAKTQPKLTLGANGFAFSSADSNFVAQLHGLVQLDSRTFFADNGINGNDGFLLRRARPIFTGTLYHDFDFNFTPDFGGSTVQIQDAYLNYRYNPALQLEAGKFKSPVGLEQLQSDPYTAFNERSLATELVPNRDLGVELHGDLLGGAASYALGLFNGGSDYNGTTVNTTFQDDKTFAGRVFFQPWKNSDVSAARGFGFGVGGSYQANHPATNTATGLTPGYTTDGQQKFFAYSAGVNANGAAWRISPQAYYYYGPFGLLAEYVISDQQVRKNAVSADLDNTAWEVSGSWLLTGEDAAYNGVTPRHPFDPRNNQWGAWQLVARYADLSVDRKAFKANGGNFFASSATSADEAGVWSVGLNWYLNKNIRANLSYAHTAFTGYTGPHTSGVIPAQSENVLFSRLQLAF
jgi:phosphate-selective porin OprO/OprP